MKQPICHVCGHTDLSPFLQQGDMPIAHHLYTGDTSQEARYPFALTQCTRCHLVQISEPIDPDILYAETDSYLTGFQKPQHLDDLIATLCAFKAPSSVLDIGCNDGSLLERFAAAGYTKLLGIEPCKPAAKAAAAKGLDVYADMLSPDSAQRIVAEHGKTQVIVLRHVLEHISDVRGAMALMHDLLDDGGLLAIELPAIEQAFAQGNPSVLWEEHVNYFTKAYTENMMPGFGFKVIASRDYAFGGGSFALICQKQADKVVVVPESFEPNPERLRQFPEAYHAYKQALSTVLMQAKNKGYTICLYGAAPRSCCLLNGLGLGAMIDVVIDDREDIQHFILPGIGKEIIALDKAPLKPAAPVLCLLAVGAEKEHRVTHKIAEATGGEVVHISLFPQRDTVASLKDASQKIG